MAKKRSPNEQQKASQQHQLEWVDFDSVAHYADIVRISSSERQFLLSFAQSKPDSQKVKVVSQVVLHPKTAGELLVILATQVAHHEKRLGKITPEKFEIKERTEKDAN